MANNSTAFSADWWHISTTRACKEPDNKTSTQLRPEAYYASGRIKKLSETEEDFRRVILSLSFRSQKDKTQVFPLDQELHVRTRLSHSYEVATNASLLFSELISRSEDGGANRNDKTTRHGRCISDLIADGDVDPETLRYALMAACLLHDVGNPPYGHEGESIIREWFKSHSEQKLFGKDSDSDEVKQRYKDLAEYEGNATSLRIALCPTSLFDGRRLNLTGLTLASLIKYPWRSTSEQANRRKKFGVYLSDENRLKNAIKASGGKLPNLDNGERHPLSYLLEAADDISYVTSDLEDSFRMGILSVHDLLQYLFDFDSKDPTELFESMESFKSGTTTEIDNGKKIRLESNYGGYTFSLFNILALMCGTQEDIRNFERLREKFYKHTGTKTVATRPNLYREIDGLEDGLDFTSYFESSDKVTHALDYLGTPSCGQHTFAHALAEHPGMNAYEQRQLQEAYVSRWVDLVRRWLCFSTAKQMAKNPTLFEPDSSEETNEYTIFGEHRTTVRMLKQAMRHFVYDSKNNLELNLTAKTVMTSLLDLFIPEAIKDETFGLSQSSSNTMRLIPLRYRLDYQARRDEYRYRHGSEWDSSRGAYERCLAVLDFISSMTDDYAIELYRKSSSIA